MAYVYLVGSGRYMVKVGKAHDVRKRIATLQTASPRRLELIHTIEVPDQLALTLEKHIHRALKTWRTVGEWFAMEHQKAVIKANFVTHKLAQEHALAKCDENGASQAKIRCRKCGHLGIVTIPSRAKIKFKCSQCAHKLVWWRF